MIIKKGNFYNNQKSGDSYSMWTSGYDVLIEEGQNGTKRSYYRLRNFSEKRVSQIEPIEIEGAIEITWEELAVCIRSKHCKKMYPNANQRDLNLLIYGMQEGSRINEENEWVEVPLVHNSFITNSLLRDLGHFERVTFLQTVTRWVGASYKNYLYVIDDKWLVTVNPNNFVNGEFYDSYSIEDYQKIRAKEKSFGIRVARISQCAEVPWDIGVFVGHIDNDEEAISILQQIKACRGNVSKQQKEELTCDIGRRTSALGEILGETWKKINNCNVQRSTIVLANYLAGE